MAARLYEERSMTLYLHRAAFAADREEVDRFLDSIQPQEDYKLSKPSLNVSIPSMSFVGEE